MGSWAVSGGVWWKEPPADFKSLFGVRQWEEGADPHRADLQAWRSGEQGHGCAGSRS